MGAISSSDVLLFTLTFLVFIGAESKLLLDFDCDVLEVHFPLLEIKLNIISCASPFKDTYQSICRFMLRRLP